MPGESLTDRHVFSFEMCKLSQFLLNYHHQNYQFDSVPIRLNKTAHRHIFLIPIKNNDIFVWIRL